MKNYLLVAVSLSFGFYLNAQTYTVGTQNITWTDAARSNRSVPFEIRYPGTNSTVANDSFPFIVFGHGFQMTGDNYYSIFDSLVKRGYIVALAGTETSFSPSHTDFGKDFIFIYNKLISESQTNASSPFYHHVIAKGAIGGHSMGGGSTVLSCQFGTPATCYFTFAAATTNPSSISAAHFMDKPYLAFAGSRDCIAPPATNEIPMYDSSSAPCKVFVEILNATHCQFGSGNLQCNFGEGVSGCAATPLSRNDQINKALSFLTPYLDYYLKGNCAAWTLFESVYSSNTVDTLRRNCINTIPSNPAISGTPSFCSGSSTTLTANPSGFNYSWSNGSTTQTSSISSVGSYSVTISNGVCSLAANSVSVVQNLPPGTPSAITASDTVCSSIANINISVVNDPIATVYNWNLPNGWSITSGNNTNAIQATSGAIGGTISVTAQNSCGTTSAVVKAITVVPSNLGTPGTINGASLICAGATVSYSITPVSGANAYLWSSPNGWTVISLNPDTAISYTAGDSSGTISVSAVNGCGQSVASTVGVTSHTTPSLGILYGLDTICLNNTGTLNFSLSSVVDADSVVWSASNPWTIAGGQGSSVLSVNSYQSNGSISVYASNECGSTTPLSYHVTYVDTPQITITQQGSVLSANSVGAINYQWYNGGALIPGATSADYTPISTGDYAVSVTNQYGCSAESSLFSFVYNGVNEAPTASLFSVFPNPSIDGTVQVHVGEEFFNGEIKMFDAMGRKVFAGLINSSYYSINISFLSGGVYLLRIEKDGKILYKKVMKE